MVLTALVLCCLFTALLCLRCEFGAGGASCRTEHGGAGPGWCRSHLHITLHSHWPVQLQGGVKASPASAHDRELSGCWSQGKDLYILSLLESVGKGHSKDPAKAKDVHA